MINYTDLKQVILNLKNEGVSRDEILDALEFDSDEDPDNEIIDRLIEQVYGGSDD